LEQSVAFLEFELIFSIGVAFVIPLMIIFYVVYPYDKDLEDIASRLTQNGSRWLDAALDSGGYQPDHEADTPQDRDADEDDLEAQAVGLPVRLGYGPHETCRRLEKAA
jgi:hypothetical protein